MLKDKMDKSGSYWGDGEDLTDAEKRERKNRLSEKAPFLLCVRTDSYTGNFERELVAFAIGKLDNVQASINYAPEYIKAFWNAAEGKPINSYEDYLAYLNKPRDNKEEHFLSAMDKLKDDVSDEVKKMMDELSNVIGGRSKVTDEYAALYNEYLCHTYQVVDDWEQETFYHIDKYYKDGNNCDCVYIQLNKPLDGRFEKIIIQRIIGFFESNIYKTFDAYISLCNGHPQFDTARSLEPKLVSLELITNNGEVVKNYNDWRSCYDRNSNN